MTYVVDEAFPGSDAQAVVERDLLGRGWTRRSRDLAGQSVPLESEWQTINTTTGGATIMLLARYWQDRHENVLAYVFGYRYLSDEDRNNRLEVMATFLPYREAKRLEVDEHQQLEHLKRSRAIPGKE